MSAPHPRTAPAGRGLRTLRAAVFAAVCVVLAAAGHSLASCAAVPLWTLGAGFLGALVVVAPLAGRARSLPGIAALLVVGQTVLHALFGMGQSGMGAMAMGSSGPTGSAPVLSDAELVQRAARYVCGATAAAISPAQAYRILVDAHAYAGAGAGLNAPHHSAASPFPMGVAALLPSLPMLLVHVLAALATGWVLRRGDLALLRLIELSAHGVAETALVRSLRGALALVRALCAGLPTAAGTGPRLPRTADSAPLTPHTTALQHTVIRRGPPAAAALALAA
ncbi:hypothetical protein ACIOC2_21005 [Streptomyces sp. NPDC088337]|uniref:hypothetical protein n=1 Tax=unclassified Streptomyces TaxID=2593676 RepID=UPI002DDA4BB0|nr:hypothetical protein [Streptomyces sp. NBC_01788]WSB27616.1 hypothetical protein OIE49_17960 [Streptomyces sp. NBC_01788]